jgi:predicted nucleotidyltransferase
MTDFRQLLGLPAEHEVAFIIIGGAAAIVHGSSRLTQDLDLVYERTPENLARLVEALQGQSPYPRGAPPGLPFSWSVATLRRGLNFPLETSLGQLDLLGEVTGGGGYDELVSHTIEVQVFGISCRCLDLETLVRTKRAVGRPKDLEALAELEALLDEHRG